MRYLNREVALSVTLQKSPRTVISHFSPRLGEINPGGVLFPNTVAPVRKIHWEESFRARAATPECKSRVFTQEHEARAQPKSLVGAAK